MTKPTKAQRREGGPAMKKLNGLSDLQRLTLDYGRIYWEANNTHSLIQWLFINGYIDKAQELEEFQRLAIRETRANYEKARERILKERAKAQTSKEG